MSKRIFVLLAAFLVCASPVFASSFTTTVYSGLLTTQNGTSDLSNGSLLILIGDPNTTGINTAAAAGDFSTPLTAGGPVVGIGSADIVLGAYAMDSTTSGVPGETDEAAFSIAYTSTFVQGDKIALRWFSGYTYAQYQANTPLPSSATYGTYTTIGDTTAPDTGVPWEGPAAGGTYTGVVGTGPNDGGGLNFFTTNDAGTQTPASGEANSLILPVPEPSTFALVGAGFLVVAGSALRKRQIGQQQG